MISNISSTTPVANADGSISAVVLESHTLPSSGTMLRLWLPISYDAGAGFGRYFLVRCAEDTERARADDWSIYARRPLFCAGTPTAMPDGNGSAWELLIPGDSDAGHRWLMQRTAGSSINLLGPLGQLFTLAATTRTLFVLTDAARLPLTLPVLHTMLDRGGRVGLIIKGDTELASALLPLIPIPVETTIMPDATWLSKLEKPVRWADQLCAALPPRDYPPLANALRNIRFRLDPDFAHVLYPGDLLCGVGACLACAVPTRDGAYTRACIHGPVFPLTTIA